MVLKSLPNKGTIAMTLPANQQFVYPRAMFHLTVNLTRLSATSPNAASAHHWLNHGCQVSCSLPEHYATSAAQHTGTILVLYLKTIACLTSQKPSEDT
jgi:hypothetical protein